MAMTRLQAKQYIARALGAEGNATQLAAAQDALFSAIEEWNLRRSWNFLKMDTSEGFSVASCTITGDGVTTNTTTTAGFIGVNVGQTVTGTGVPASTTVASITDEDTIVLSQASTPGTVTLTFGGDIPIRQNVDTYNLPTPFKQPYICRITSGNERTLDWMDQSVIDKMFQNQAMTQTPVFYNLFNKTSFTRVRQNGKIRFFPMPAMSETARVRFFRPIAQPAVDGDFLDLPDRYIYAMLELARWHYLKNHDSETERLTQTYGKANELFVWCREDDEGESTDREVVMVAQVDHAAAHQIITDEVAGWP
jgi:hypothetical protein